MTHKAAIIGIGVPDVLLDVPFSSEKLSRYLADKFEAKQVSITDIHALSGGAIQENWSLNLQIDGGKYDGVQKWVLRKDAPSCVSVSNSRSTEFVVLSHAFANGVTTPKPICLCEDERVIGGVFFVMEAMVGQAQAHKLVRLPAFAQGSNALACQLGTEMALLHKTMPTAELTKVPRSA
jgi:aminoglycoside phosphotransferase (APT) family kinase protein